MAADPTPTTVGIIQGDVRLESAAFFAEIARVRAAIRSLKEDDPTVRVEAETGDALARLAEVRAAAEAAGGEQTITVESSGSAADAVRARMEVAAATDAETQAVLDLARAKVLAAQAAVALDAADASSGFQGDTLRPTAMGAGPESGHMAADWREANEAISEATSVGKDEQIILDGLEAAEKHVRVATDDLADSEKKATKAGSGHVSQMQLIMGVIAALIPMVAPLGGYLIGLSGGFAAMGAAGVLAFLGAKRAMADGTAEGNLFAAGLNQIRGNLDDLESTAATATLPGFTTAVGVLQAAMPGLVSETGVFGTMLGNTVGPAVKTVLDVMLALAPAFATGAAQLQDFLVGLDGWATGANGARAFGDYMVGVMPQVGEVLNHIITTVGLLVTELAPLGSTMLGIINVALGLVNVAEGLGPAFAPAVAGALALWGAMKGWGLLAPLLTSIAAALGPVNAETALYVDLLASEPGVLTAVTAGEAEAAAGATALGGAIDFAAGPVGWIVGLIGALAAGLLVAANASEQATAATTDYSAAVQQDNGIIGENTRQAAANALQKNGAAAAGEKLGLSLTTMTDAALGQAAAQKQVADAVQRADEANVKANETRRYGTVLASAENRENDKTITLVTQQRASIQAAIKAYNDLQGALGGTKITTEAQLRAQTALAAKYGESLPTYLTAVAAQRQQAAQAKAATAAMVQENDAAGLLKQGLDLLNGKTLGVQEAQTAAAAATNSLEDALKQNGTAIDGTSKAAVANQQAVQQVVQANQAAAEAISKATGSSKQGVAAYEASKTALEHNLDKLGLLTPAMKKYIDKLYDLKNLHIPPTKLDVEETAALAKINRIKAYLASIKARSVDVYVNLVQGGVDPGIAAQVARNARYGAAGGTAGTDGFGHLAYGGTGFTVHGPGSSLSDTAGLYHLANGEEVISNRNGQADAWRPLLKAINSGDFRGVRLGDGGERQTPSTIKTVNMGGIHLHSPVAQDPVQAAEDASQMIVAYAGFPL